MANYKKSFRGPKKDFVAEFIAVNGIKPETPVTRVRAAWDYDMSVRTALHKRTWLDPFRTATRVTQVINFN